jgi:hypothetical protein
VRTECWRYVHWSYGASELDDGANDPEETCCVAGAPRSAVPIGGMQAHLKQVEPFKPAEISQPQRPKHARQSGA